MKTINRAEILTNAWKMFKQVGNWTFSECLKNAWCKARFAELQFQKQQERLAEMNASRRPNTAPILEFNPEKDSKIIGSMIEAMNESKSLFKRI